MVLSLTVTTGPKTPLRILTQRMQAGNALGSPTASCVLNHQPGKHTSTNTRAHTHTGAHTRRKKKNAHGMDEEGNRVSSEDGGTL